MELVSIHCILHDMEDHLLCHTDTLLTRVPCKHEEVDFNRYIGGKPVHPIVLPPYKISRVIHGHSGHGATVYFLCENIESSMDKLFLAKPELLGWTKIR